MVRDVGRLFIHGMAYPGRSFPLVDRGYTQETSEPYRSGVSVVIRAPLTRRAVVLGLWGRGLSEEEALERAIGGSLVGYRRGLDVVEETYVPGGNGPSGGEEGQEAQQR